MYNLQIRFTYPWALLLLIPALLLTFIPYFRSNKKYRRNRNRITSMVLHAIVITLSILTLSGISFFYQLPNEKNEILLLIDVSDTVDMSEQSRDDAVRTVIEQSMYDNFKVGVVTFGFDQKYAVPLTDDVDSVYEAYLGADLPDTTATNIAGALTYAKDLLTHPESAKIVLITDGKETDGNAKSAIQAITAQGTKMDAIYIKSDFDEADAQVLDITLPEYHVKVNESCPITVSVYSHVKVGATIELYDGLEKVAEDTFELSTGTQTFTFNHAFEKMGLHELSFKIIANGDNMVENNEYYSYMYLEVFNKILIVERTDGESDALVAMLKDNVDAYEIETVNVTSDALSTDVNDLLEYDQIIMNNIANADMPEGFDEALYSFVYDYGGGVFTTGGTDESGEAHAYNRRDMYGSLYQSMLPVQAIDYTPPLGLFVIIDRSGSMGSIDNGTGSSKLELAQAGAYSCLSSLSERDYMGIMTLESDSGLVLPLTRRTEEQRIREAIYSFDATGGGTMFAPALKDAGKALQDQVVDKRHIILITDGMPGDSKDQDTGRYAYEDIAAENYANGISLSIVGIGIGSFGDAADRMESLAALGGGKFYSVSGDDLVSAIRSDLTVDALKEVTEEVYKPTVNIASSSLLNGIEFDEDNRGQINVELGGFFGVKKRDNENVSMVLTGDYSVPLYCQWKFGKGMVGSFMCDLNGTDWSQSFMADKNGKQFIYNVIDNLMPTSNIRPQDFSLRVVEDNYTTKISLDGHLESGDRIEGYLVSGEGDDEVKMSLNEVSNGEGCYVVTALSSDNNYSRCNFVLKDSGVYKLLFVKYNANGDEIGSLEYYKVMSYSKEYDNLNGKDEKEIEQYLSDLAEMSGGKLVEDAQAPDEIFENFVTEIDSGFDPRALFMILALILFLLDIAVRKFKFKWPHELIRDYRNRKQ